MIWQEPLVGAGLKAAEIAPKVLPYRLAEALQALEDGAPYVFWVEGEPCVDALRALGLFAVTSIGGAGKFKPERDGNLFPPERLVVCPDRDRPGIQHAEDIAAAYPGCQWLYPFPGTLQWNGSCPANGGLDIADWIATGATAEQILAGVGPKLKPKAQPSGEAKGDSPIDEWDAVLKGLVDPNHPGFEKNSIRRQIRAATSARDLGVAAAPQHVRGTLLQHQRNLITGTAEKGTKGGDKARFKPKEYLINNLIAKRCLTGIAAFNKVGKTKLATELVASLIFQTPFMGNPEWMPAPGHHKVILWWVDQPGADSSAYLKARGLMEPDGTLHPQIVALYTEEDDLAWDDQGMDRLIRDTADNPGVTLITDSFFACIQRIHGNDQEPEAGGALIDIQTLLSQTETTHICLFHSPKETGPVGINAIRGHGSAGAAVSGCISLHFLEKKDPQTGKFVADKDNPHRRMVYEGRGPYIDLLIRGDWQDGTFDVIGPFQQKIGELLADERKGTSVTKLTEGQRQTLEWVGGAISTWKQPDGATALQVASCKVQHLDRSPTVSEIENTRKQLNALTKLGLLSATQKSRVTRYSYRG